MPRLGLRLGLGLGPGSGVSVRVQVRVWGGVRVWDGVVVRAMAGARVGIWVGGELYEG